MLRIHCVITIIYIYFFKMIFFYITRWKSRQLHGKDENRLDIFFADNVIFDDAD